MAGDLVGDTGRLMMKIERHIVYVAMMHPGTRADYKDADGNKKMAISLPRVPSLEKTDPGEEKKYYKPEEIIENIVVPSSAEQPKDIRRDLYKPLTPREARVLEMVKNGWTNKEIALRIHRSESVVRSYVSIVKRKMALRSIELEKSSAV